jgi:hypothetical protein
MTGSSVTPSAPAQQPQQQQQPDAGATVTATVTAAAAAAASTHKEGVSLAQPAFNPTAAALRLQALQDQQLLEIAAQERALKERQAFEKKAKALEKGNVHVQHIELVMYIV